LYSEIDKILFLVYRLENQEVAFRIPVESRLFSSIRQPDNIRNLYKAGSLMTVSKQILKYKLDLMGVQEVRWEGGSTELAGEYTYFYGKGNKNHELGIGLFVYKGTISAV
jgi:hypothetical protein